MKIWNKTKNIFIAVILVLAIWQFVILITDIEKALFPSPLMVLEAMISMIADGSLWKHLQVSLGRFFVGYVSAAVSAILLGLILGRLTKVWEIVDPIVQLLRPVAPIAWAPFIVLI